MRRLVAIAAVLTCLSVPSVSYAQQAPMPECDYFETCEPTHCWCCKDMLKKCIAQQMKLAENGLIIAPTFTQFFQSVTSGGQNEVSRYGAKLDLFLLADTEKMGLWDGGSFLVHAADWQFGENVVTDAVGLAPVNINLLTPRPEESFGLTTLLYTQELNESYSAIIGRSNILDFWNVLYPDYGRGVDGFMNISLLLPMNAVPSLPFITNLAGIEKKGERGIEAAFIVIDSQNAPTTSGMDVNNGVTLAALGRIYTDFGGQPGSHTFLATYATGKFTSFDTSGWVILPGGGILPTAVDNNWMAAYMVEQRLWTDPCNKKRYTKLFGKVGYSDVNTSPFRCTASLSFEAFGPMRCRPDDRMGIGYFYTGLNSDFRGLFSRRNPLDDLHGGEIYYNMAVTKICRVTADLQVINPGPLRNDTAVVFGLRAKVGF